MTTIVVQEWEESERGWGVEWDGWSLHLSSADRDAFVQDHWDSLPDGFVPDVYSRPAGKPTLYDVEFNEELINQIRESKNGIRTYESVFGE